MESNQQSALYTGLLSSTLQTLAQPPWSCPTGNCTWNPFPTLAIGLKCIDISEKLLLDCPESDDNCFMDLTNSKDIPENGETFTDLSSSVVFQSQADIFRFQKPPDPERWDLPAITNTSVDIKYFSLVWAKINNITTPADEMQKIYISRNSTLEAHQCLLYVAMQEILAEVRDSVYSEKVLREINLQNWIHLALKSSSTTHHLTMIVSRRARVGIWKGNPLALLLHTDWQPREGIAVARIADDIEELSKGLLARVVDGGDGRYRGIKGRFVVTEE